MVISIIRTRNKYFAIRYTIAMRVLGIDPGLATIGIGLAEGSAMKPGAIEWLTIETAAATPLAERLREIEDDVSQYLQDTQPEMVVVEKLYFSVNEKTALDVAHARGVIMATVARQNIPILEPTPPELKSCIAGDGSADKRQMQEMVKMLFRLDEIPTPDDAADALALAAFGLFQGNTATLLA